MSGFIGAVSRELAQAAERVAAKYGKQLNDVLSDPKLRAEAENEVAGKVRFDKSQPATMQDVSDQARGRALPGTIGPQPDDSLRSRLLSAGEGPSGASGTPGAFDAPVDVDPLPAVDLYANMLRRRINQGLAGTAAGAGMAYGVSGGWGSDDQADASTVGQEPEAAGEPDSSGLDDSEEPFGGSDTMPPEPQEVKLDSTGLDNALKRLEEYEKNYKAAGADTREIEAQISEAKQLYKDSATRNEALGLAQLIGQSLARMGAAIYGNRQGRSIVGSLEMPSVDYEKRTDRAREDFRDTLSSLDARRRETTAAAERSEREKFERGRAPLRDALDVEKYKLGQNVDLASQSLRDRVARGREDAQRSRTDINTAQAEYKQAVAEEKEVNRQKQNIDILANAIASDSKKDRDRVANLAGKAGIDPEELQDIMDNAPKEKGMLWDSADPKAQASAVRNSLMAGISDKLEELKARKQAARAVLDKKKQGKAGTPQPTNKQVTKQQLQEYMKQYNMNEQAARDYLQSQGYTIK